MSPKAPRVFCIGNGVSKFRPPIKEDDDSDKTYSVLDEAVAACTSALKEAAFDYSQVDAAVCGYVYADSSAGQAVLYRLGLSGIPIYNVNNNCATGSSALSLAKALVASGQHDCVLAVGFEQIGSEGLKETTPEHKVFERHFAALQAIGIKRAPTMGMGIAAAYSAAATEHATNHGTTQRHYATVTCKNRLHGKENPNALLHDVPVPSLEDVLQAPTLGKRSPLTFAMLAPLACGAAAAVLVSEKLLHAHSGKGISTAVEIIGQSMTSDNSATFDTSTKAACVANICGFDISRRAADLAYSQAGIGPGDVDVVEVHDAFASNEVAMYEALRLCDEGSGGALVDSGKWLDNGNGGKLFNYQRPGTGTVVVNTSGGIESKGHPLGATGVAQCAELCWQLRGVAGRRQKPGAHIGLQHNYGWASSAVVTIYRQVHLNQSSKL